MKIEIKHRYTKEVIFECEADSLREVVEIAVKKGANLRYADLRYADLRYANLSYADLSYADLRYAILSGANLRYANLSYADLRYAILRYANTKDIKNDFFEKLSKVKEESIGLYKYLIEGKIDGSCYSGECACFCGTISILKNMEWNEYEFKETTGITPDGNSLVEKWFLAINEGDTPQNNPVSDLTREWLEEFMTKEGLTIPKMKVVWE